MSGPPGIAAFKNLTPMNEKSKAKQEKQNITRLLASIVSETVESSADEAVTRLRKNHRKIVSKWRDELFARAEETTKSWTNCLDSMELAITQASICSEEFESLQPQRSDPKFLAISGLLDESVGIAEEILLLLRNGFASGAYARWRSLHERAILALFVSRSSRTTAKRFLDHEAVKSLELLSEAQRFCELTGVPPLPSEWLRTQEENAQRMIERYGADFVGKYAWAKLALAKVFPTRKGGVTFNELVQACGLNFMRSPYGLASHAVHATPVSVRAWIDTRWLVTLAEPAANTLISLTQCADAANMYAPFLMRRIVNGANQTISEEAVLQIFEAYTKFPVTVSAFQKLAFATIDSIQCLDDVQRGSAAV